MASVYAWAMKRSVCNTGVVLAACLTLLSCGNLPPRSDGAAPVIVAALAPGSYSNHEQVWQAQPLETPPVQIDIAALGREGWVSWRTRLAGATRLDATWAMRVVSDPSGGVVVTPHRALEVTAEPARFDPETWTALEGCALRGSASATRLELAADPAACAAIAPGIGAQAALLPLTIEQDGEWLRVRLFSDQARGADARTDARRMHWFEGWAAVNGAGRNATADNVDWHMNRGLRLGSEGGRQALNWRDGSASGYSLLLERLTYREGGTPVLKLSVIEDASAAVIVYAWANPEATRIGINLGWVQIGLEREVEPLIARRRVGQ